MLLPALTCDCTQKCLWQEINIESERHKSILRGPIGGFNCFSRSAVQFIVLKNCWLLMALILPDVPSRLFGSLVRNILIPVQQCRVSTEEVANVCISQLPYHSFAKIYTMLTSKFVKTYRPVSNSVLIKRPLPLEVADLHTFITWMMNFKCL